MQLARRHPFSSLRRLALIGAAAILVFAAAIVVARISFADSPKASLVNGAIPKAEVVHVVASHTVGETVEFWIDRATGDAIQKTTNDAGEVTAVIQRHGRTLSDYLAFDGKTSLITRTVQADDDPVLLRVTVLLDQYRWGFDSGKVTRVEGGRTEYNDQAVIEVNAWADTEMEQTALIDAETLYPVAVFPTGGGEVHFTYSVIESVEPSDLDRSVFEFDYGDPTYAESYEMMTVMQAAEFTSYPVSSLGDAFGSYALERVEHQVTNATETRSASDDVYFIYRQRDGQGQVVNEITVKNRDALTDEERTENDRAVADGIIQAAEDVQLATGETVRVRPTDSSEDSAYWIELDRADGYVYLNVPDRETGLSAAEALLRVNSEASGN